MDKPLRVLQVVHGYPPRETAGVEQHTRALSQQLAARGHTVAVLAATRAPGRTQYATLVEQDGPVSVTRLVNNIPARPLADAERDRAVEACARDVAARFRPDVVHIQHVQFLSAGMRFTAPVVLTLHDGWGWCPAGGAELLPDRRRCPGPTPARCAPCYAAWRPVPSPTARRLMALAGAAAPLISPERLHRLWARLPAAVRAPVAAERPAPAEDTDAVTQRAEAMRAFFAAAALRLAPSRYLAERAAAQGLNPVEIHRNGAALPAVARRGGGPLVFLGTLAPHKGPDLVLQAWRAAFPGGQPGLRFYGPRGASDVPGAMYGGLLDRRGVASVLSGATALVMGSRWPENAPLVLLEARAAGCPVVAPRIGGVPELIEDGVDGLLYPPGDVGALAQRLRDVAAAPPGPPRPPPTAAQQADALVTRYRALCR